MKIEKMGDKNCCILKLDGAAVLFSYGTPVAAWINSVGHVKTSKRWSVTTSRHINQFLAGDPMWIEMPQEWFYGLVSMESVKIEQAMTVLLEGEAANG